MHLICQASPSPLPYDQDPTNTQDGDILAVRMTGVRQVTDTRQMVIMKGVTGAKLLNILGCTQVTSPFFRSFFGIYHRLWTVVEHKDGCFGHYYTTYYNSAPLYRAGCLK